MKSIILGAPAKINLSLDITGLFDDGYHKVDMIMQSIGLQDVVRLRRLPEGIRLITDCEDIPDGKENLAWKAAALFQEELGIEEGVEIYIDKNIPVAAGLAGGSTDAAAVLRGMKRLFRSEVGWDDLHKLAARIGSDVPFCLRGGTARARGRGEVIAPLPDISRENLVLIVPRFEVSTAEIYRLYDKMDLSFSVPTDNLVKKIIEGREITWSEGWGNILEKVTGSLEKDIWRVKEKLQEFDPLFTMMSGSGPAVFSLVGSREMAEYIMEKWPYREDRIFITCFKGRF
ncbi:MAG: 4-(cytidine 5'-diphospho)-2-C-methyl-D-erythritol kinase [Halanaerobiaceae bacterium]